MIQQYLGLVDGAGQCGHSIHVKEIERKIPDEVAIEFDGCFEVNPVTLVPTSFRKRFSVVIAEQGRIVITPPIIPIGQYRNCSNSPANQAMILEAA